MNKKLRNIIVVVSFILPFFIMSNVKAEEVKKSKDIYCPLCSHRDDDDPLYKKERQFYKKIKIIKSIFGDSIDEVALAAAVLHRYSGPDVAYEREYDKSFTDEKYRASWQDIFNAKAATSFGLTDEEKKQVEANDKISLLTSAAIVMIDSNHMGRYSDVCFKDALAGDKLVNNDGESGIFGDLINAFVCHIYEGASVLNPIEYITNVFNGDNILVTAESAKNRLFNTKNICENGFVGGLYSNVRSIKDEDKKSKLKKTYAQQIIDLSNYYKRLYGSGVEEENGCSLNVAGSTGEFANWRQFDKMWKDISLGGSSSVGNAGCLVTSIAMQIARSGTKIGTLPSGYSEFNPGAFVTSLNNNGGFVEKGNFGWTGYQSIAPNWGVGDFITLNENKNKELALAISRELSSGYGNENYQKFIVLQIHHATSTQHWVAVNGVDNDEVTIYDPSMSGTTLDDNYRNWVVDGYRVMYAKDVSFGQTGTTSNNTCFVNSGNTGSTGETGGTGDIKIPEEYGKGGYTVTTIDTINWAPGTGQGKLANEWKRKGAQYKNGIAVIDGRYLIACTTTFGKVGDKIDFFLDDGTKIPTIMMDEKSQEYVAWDHNPANKWGHDNGANVLEFEVANSYYRKYGNPGNGYNSWYKEWSGKRVSSATNLGGGGASTEETSNGSYCLNGVSYSSGLGNLDFSCKSDKVKANFSCDTLKIVENHLYDLNAQNFYNVINSYGGFENYARSLGGVFGEYYGKTVEGRTVTDFQRSAEYVLGWMFMYGWDYAACHEDPSGRSGRHVPWGGSKYTPDAFYVNGGWRRKYVPDYPGNYLNQPDNTDFDHVISGQNGVDGMASECGNLVNFTYKKLGIKQKKVIKNIKRLRDLRPGDEIGFWGNGGGHVVMVGEVYSDHVTFYDGGSFMQGHLDYKRNVYFPDVDSEAADSKAMYDEFKFPNWIGRRYYDFTD